MRCFLFAILVSFIMCLPALADKPLQAGVQESVRLNQIDQIRQEAFKNVVYQIDVSKYPKYDPDYKFHMQLKTDGTSKFDGGEIVFYDNGNYKVIYNNNSNCTVSYTEDGWVFRTSLFNTSNKTWSYYDINGSLLEIGKPTTSGSFVIFNMNGSFVCEWDGDIVYNELGLPIGYKRTEKF